MRCTIRLMALILCLGFTFLFHANATESQNVGKYLYVRNLDTTLTGEKLASFCGPLDEIVFFLRDKTDKEWGRSNTSFSMVFGKGVTKPSPGKIGMFPVKRQESSRKTVHSNDPNWYKITISDGVLIQGNTESELTDAAEHLIELFEGSGDDLRLPRGVYTSEDRKPERPPFFLNLPEGGRKLDALWASMDRDSQSEDDILQTVREGFLTCQTPKEQILQWIGQKYIGYNPQSRKAINLMIEAAKLPDDAIVCAAIQYGLARVSWKTLRTHRAMRDAAMQANDDGKTVRLIALALRDRPRDQRDFIETLEPYQQSPDKTIQAKAKSVRTVFERTVAESLKKTND
jgi:hypothetical protein